MNRKKIWAGSERHRRRGIRILQAILMMLFLFGMTGCKISPDTFTPNGSEVEGMAAFDANHALDREFLKTVKDSVTPGKAQFEVHFIDVGQGDASLILCDGHAMLVDGGMSNQSSKIYTYLKNAGVHELDYIVATHPDGDHVGGLAGALNCAKADVALSPVEDNDGEAFQNFLKYLEKQDVSVTVPVPGDTFELGSARVVVLAPLKVRDEINNTSIVLKVEHAGNSILLTGDAELGEEQDMLESGEDLSANVLKIGHHGSASSTGQDFLDAVNPESVVISCGEKNEYGHPSEEVLERLKEREIRVVRTDLQGTLIYREKNGKLVCEVQRNPEADVFVPGDIETLQEESWFMPETSETLQEETRFSDGRSYIANKNTMKFHYPDCDSVKQMKESNKYYFEGDRQELIDQGYVPCANCQP